MNIKSNNIHSYICVHKHTHAGRYIYEHRCLSTSKYHRNNFDTLFKNVDNREILNNNGQRGFCIIDRTYVHSRLLNILLIYYLSASFTPNKSPVHPQLRVLFYFWTVIILPSLSNLNILN